MPKKPQQAVAHQPALTPAEAWIQKHGAGHLLAQLELARANHRRVSLGAPPHEQVRAEMEVASLTAEVTEKLISRPAPEEAVTLPVTFDDELVDKLAFSHVADSDLPHKAMSALRDYWFANVVPLLRHDKAGLNAETFKQEAELLVRRALEARKTRSSPRRGVVRFKP